MAYEAAVFIQTSIFQAAYFFSFFGYISVCCVIDETISMFMEFNVLVVNKAEMIFHIV